MKNILKNQSIYLPGLNGIRAIAAIAVIISHIGLNLNFYNMNNLGNYPLASFGVTMFFALSGFLITYLLLVEKKNTNLIDIKKFYIRRLLRIWPLYYFYLLLVILVLGLELNEYSWMYFFLLPNIPSALELSAVFPATLPFLYHYWSVGVEEQFYAFWPFVIKYSKKTLRFLVIFAVVFFVIKLLVTVLHINSFLITLFYYTRFGCLAMGAIGAYLFYQRDSLFLKFCYSKISEICSWLVILSIALNKFHLFASIEHEIVTVATIVIIINQVSNPNKIISLENNTFDYLGKISYGLYIYNPFIIYLVSLPLKNFITSNNTFNLILIYLTTITAVIIVSHISYFYFETWFLKFKDKFAVVKSKSSAS